MRRKLIGKTEPVYSQYTCYTGIADFTPPDIDTVGYRVFLGNGQYFVSSDVGGSKMQWCARAARVVAWGSLCRLGAPCRLGHGWRRDAEVRPRGARGSWPKLHLWRLGALIRSAARVTFSRSSSTWGTHWLVLGEW